MRQAFRRYAFPIMIIAAVLAAALPLNSFAINISTVTMTDNFSYNSLASNSWQYLFNSSTGSSYNTYFSSRILTYPTFEDSDPVVNSNVFSRSSFLSYSRQNTLTYEFRIPFFLYDIYSLDFNFYFGVNKYERIAYPYNLVDIVLHTSSSTSVDLPFSLSSGYQISPDNEHETSGDSFLVDYYNISYSSTSSFDALYLSFIYTFDIPSSASSSNFLLYHFFALGVNSSFSTLSSNVDAIMQSHSILAQLLDTVISQQSSNHAQIIDYLDQILAAVESGGGTGSGGSGSDPGTGEGEEILQEGAIKQEQLEQLGDALSNVPKPSIENITQSFDPADTLISADPGMIQNALSIVYSWDKFLILLGLFIAVGTISYIIFGKKS